MTHDRPAGIVAAGLAEFQKIGASRVPAVILAALPVACYLFVFELFHVEHADTHLKSPAAFDAFALLYFMSWKTLLFQATVVAFAAYWTTVDSQYGMIRVAACQPLTRVTYLLGKWLGIGMWIAIFTLGFVISLFGWAVLYEGGEGLGFPQSAALARFSLQVIVFTLAIGSVAAATASLRTTVGAGIVTAILGVILLAMATTLPFDVLAPRFVLMRFFFFALGELPDPFGSTGDSAWVRLYSGWDFYRTAIVTPLAFALPAVWRFHVRDVEE